MKIVKRLFFAVISLMIVNLSCAFAQTNSDNRLKLIFDLSDSWTECSDDERIMYRYGNGMSEEISVTCETAENIYSLDDMTEIEWKKVCGSFLSNESIAGALETLNDIDKIEITEKSVSASYESHNSVRYFRYEKSYTARAELYDDLDCYCTVFVTLRGGKLYKILYDRDESSNHFDDLSEMLETMQFENVIKIKVNDEIIYPDSDPLLINNRTLVPIRAVAEKLGYDVEWDSVKQLVILTESNGEGVLYFEIGSGTAQKNQNRVIPLDVPAAIISNRTYLPLRAVAEAMDATVNWNEDENTVEILGIDREYNKAED